MLLSIWLKLPQKKSKQFKRITSIRGFVGFPPPQINYSALQDAERSQGFYFLPPCMYIQRFDRVLFCFIFIVLASNYSLKPPRFYGNKGIILNQWTAKYGACPINPEEQVLFIPIVPLNAEIAPIDKSFQDWPRQERTAPWLCLMES